MTKKTQRKGADEDKRTLSVNKLKMVIALSTSQKYSIREIGRFQPRGNDRNRSGSCRRLCNHFSSSNMDKIPDSLFSFLSRIASSVLRLVLMIFFS